MDFRCPSCQKDLTVPDEYAGQLMKCPLCQNTFQAPALPPPVTVSPPAPAGPGAYSVSPEPPPAPPAPQQEAPRRKKETPAAPPTPPPPLPTGDYAHTTTLWLSPRVIPWMTPAALVLIFFLTFFPWASVYPPLAETRMAWGWAFSEGNALTILYLLVFVILLLPLSVAITVLRLVPDAIKLPPALQQVWPWRAALVALLAAVTFFFLVLQLFVGFNLKDVSTGVWVLASGWAWLVLVLHFIALFAALLDFWLEIRGAGRPAPRVDISW